MPYDKKPPEPPAETTTVETKVTKEPAEGSVPGMPAPPKPTDVIPVDMVDTLGKAVNAASEFLFDGELPPVKVGPPSDAKNGIGGTKAPLDPMVWERVVTLAAAVGQVASEDPSLQSLSYDPMAVTTTDGMRDVVSKLDQLSRSEDAKKAVTAMVDKMRAGMSEEPEGAPAPDEATSEELAPVPPATS